MKEEPAGLVLAKALAGWGIKVIPAFVTREDDKIPMAGKDWVNKATTEVSQLEQWWSERPYCRVGVVSGMDSCWLFDCDGPEAVDWLRAFILRNGGWVPGSLCYRTPGKGGGLHILYRPPRRVAEGGWYSGADIPQAKVRMPGGNGEVQLRGRAHWSLVIGPDRRSGSYELVEQPPESGPVEAPQSWVEPFLAEAELVAVSGGGDGDLRELSPERAWADAPWTDNRKNAVAGLAWYLAIRDKDDDYDAVMDKCLAFAAECCEPQLEESVVVRKVEYTVSRVAAIKEKQRADAQKTLQAIMNRGRRFD